MAFNKDLDVAVAEWSRHDEDTDTTLQVSVRSYNESEPKLQIGPRMFVNKSGEEKFRKAGRLNTAETKWLLSIASEISKAISPR
jgi:hypothetical protein